MRGAQLFLVGACLVVGSLGLGLKPGQADHRQPWRFQTQVRVTGEYITLADLARLTPEQAQRYGEFIIWSAPPPGEVYTLTREFLGYRLSQPGGPGKAARSQLPVVIKVKRTGVVVGMEQLGEIFRQHVCEHSPWPAEALHIQIFPPIPRLAFPPGKLSFQVISPADGNYLGQVALEVLILRDGKLENKVKLTGEVTLTRPVVCCRRNLRSREVIGVEDIKVIRREFSRLPPGGIITEPSQVIGKALKRSLRAGVVISPRDLINAPLIKRGDRVLIRFERSGLTITAKGKAREPGFVGKSIRVINCASKKELQARVINQKTVRVEL